MEPTPNPEPELEPAPDPRARQVALYGLVGLAGVAVLLLALRALQRRQGGAAHLTEGAPLEELPPAVRASLEHLAAATEQRLEGQREELERLAGDLATVRVQLLALLNGAGVPAPESEAPAAATDGPRAATSMPAGGVKPAPSPAPPPPAGEGMLETRAATGES